jgi:hypothetical protein
MAGFIFYLAAGIAGTLSYMTFRGSQNIYIVMIVAACISAITALSQVGRYGRSSWRRQRYIPGTILTYNSECYAQPTPFTAHLLPAGHAQYTRRQRRDLRAGYALQLPYAVNLPCLHTCLDVIHCEYFFK